MKRIYTLGCIEYSLNYPLLHNLKREPKIKLSYGSPSNIVNQLNNGELEGGLSSIVANWNNDNLYRIPDIGIGSCGEVGSVLVFLKLGIKKIEECFKIALDPASRSANMLLQCCVKLSEIIHPIEFEVVSGNPTTLLKEGYDGVLRIGNSAISTSYNYTNYIDLSSLWYALTDLPFVFGAWFINKEKVGDDLHKLESIIINSLDTSEECLKDAAKSLMKLLILPNIIAEKYFKQQIVYRFNSEFDISTRLFKAKCEEFGLVDYKLSAKWH